MSDVLVARSVEEAQMIYRDFRVFQLLGTATLQTAFLQSGSNANVRPNEKPNPLVSARRSALKTLACADVPAVQGIRGKAGGGASR